MKMFHSALFIFYFLLFIIHDFLIVFSATRLDLPLWEIAI